MGWATFWAFISQAHLVNPDRKGNCNENEKMKKKFQMFGRKRIRNENK
jgi:hypothetical protein